MRFGQIRLIQRQPEWRSQSGDARGNHLHCVAGFACCSQNASLTSYRAINPERRNFFFSEGEKLLGLCGGRSVVAHEEREWRDKKQNVHQRADLTAIPRNFKRLIGIGRCVLAIAKQPLD
jgi:hypothetical protein